MDIQLNLSTSSQKNNKAPNKKKPNKTKANAINQSNFNFVQKPKIEGKIVARKRNVNQNEVKKSTFSFLKNNEKELEAKPNLPSNESKDNIRIETIKEPENDLALNVSTNVQKKIKSATEKQESKSPFNKNNNFKQKRENKSDNFKRDFKDRKPQSSNPDEIKRPTFKQISGLFRNNPEIPKIGQRHVKPIDEKLFSGKKFTDLNIHDFSVANLEKNLNLKELTVIQQKAVPIILQGRDVLIRSQTGSGKTLAYALPIIEALQAIRPKLQRQDGIKALVIVPTRELAIQTYELFVKLVKPFTRIVPGYLIGGEKRKAEKARIRKGFNILIGTPGRISDHLQNTASLKFEKTRCLILDEADRLLDMGYEKDVSGIVQALETHKAHSKYDPMALIRKNIKETHVRFSENEDEDINKSPEKSDDNEKPASYTHELSNVFNSDKRQTVLLSATLTKAVETLAGLTMENPVFVDSSEERGTIIADSIAIPVKKEDESNSDNVDDDDELEIVPQENSDNESESDEEQDDSDDDDKNSDENDDSNDENDSDGTSDSDSSNDDDGEDAVKRKASIYKGVGAFGGLKILDDKPKKQPKTIEKKAKKDEKKKIVIEKSDDDSDSDYDFGIVKNKPETKQSDDVTIIKDSGKHNNPFQNAVQNALAQDEMVIPSSVTQIYIVTPMKLRLVTLGALIIEKCVNPGSGKMLVFMGTQDMIDFHCELLSRILAGRPPKIIANDTSKNQNKQNKKRKFNENDDDGEIDAETEDDKIKKLIEKEEHNDADYEYDYDGIPLDVYEAKMKAEKAFVDVEFFQLHGSMDQKTRTEVFKTFRNAKSGVLLCTDVAARGLDLPHVDCIVQYTGPISATDYVHRVGRTARAGNVGTAIMFLLPSEVQFVRQLEERRIRLHQEDMENTLSVFNKTGSRDTFNRHRGNKQAEQEAATAVQQTCEDLVEADKDLYIKACKAFTSWMRFYSTYPREVRAAFDRRALHAGHAARALALRQTPKQIAKNAPKDKQERPNNRLSNQELNQKQERKPKDSTNRTPSVFRVRPTTVKAAKRDRMMLISEFDSGLEPIKKKKK